MHKRHNFNYNIQKLYFSLLFVDKDSLYCIEIRNGSCYE